MDSNTTPTAPPAAAIAAVLRDDDNPPAARVRRALGNARAIRNRLDVPSLDNLTWDDLADVDNFLSEVIEDLKALGAVLGQSEVSR